MTFGTRNQEPLDLELITQRVLKIAEIATLEHLESLLRSQAGNCLDEDMSEEQSAAHAA